MLDHGRARSGGKLGAALAAPATNHRATRSIAHPETKAVLLLALPVVRLVRPFHPWPPRTPGPRWGHGAGARHVVELARKWTAESTGRFQNRAIGPRAVARRSRAPPVDPSAPADQPIHQSLARFSDWG